MFAESDETAREEAKETYEPPALVALGSVAELTASTADDSITFSDRVLKEEVAPLGNALGRLRALQTLRSAAV